MKRNLLLFVCLWALTAAGQDNYTIKGIIKKPDSIRKIYLFTPTGSDSTMLNNGRFIFKGKIAEPTLAAIIPDYTGKGMAQPIQDDIQFIIEKGEISLVASDSLKNSIIKGGESNAAYNRYRKTLKDNSAENRKLSAMFTDTTGRYSQTDKDSIQRGLMKLYEEVKAVNLQFVKEEKASFFSLLLLEDMVKSKQADSAELRNLLNALDKNLLASSKAKALIKEIEFKPLMVGDMAPLFSQNDTNGNPVRLSDYKNKYVLLDFWASWCKPCREENPTLVKAYEMFASKGFNILGISLDMNKQAWLKAIAADNLTWMHVSDLKYWNNEVAKLYNVGAVPQNFLIGPDGRIIAMHLRGEDLIKQLETIFN